MAWRDFAACRGVDPKLFFASERKPKERKTALAICKGCSVRRSCLEEALENGDGYIRGGTTEEDRKVMLLFKKALTPISISMGVQKNTVQTGFLQTVQASVGISYIPKPEQSRSSPTLSFELNLSECLERCNRVPLETSNHQEAASSSLLPHFSLNLVV